jgi:dTDP-glucose pyrophosphorylase
MTLVILAAGMGSRFGGLKQVTPMGPNGEFLIDYSIYDAIKYGFDKVVFIIKKENYEIFKESIGARVAKHINVEYVFQDINNVPDFVKVPKDRVKPWGTAHAIYCCKDMVKDNFAIINADDFYGADAFKQAAEFMKNNKNEHEMGMVAYLVKNTLTENGTVKRGVCFGDQANHLVKITESITAEKDGIITCNPLDGSEAFNCTDKQLVSMNMICFTPYIFKLLDNDINDYFKNSKDLMTGEFLIPDVVFNNIKKGNIVVDLIPTTAKWCGVTYKEDTDNVKATLKEYMNNGTYPKTLW